MLAIQLTTISGKLVIALPEIQAVRQAATENSGVGALVYLKGRKDPFKVTEAYSYVVGVISNE